MKMTIKGKEYTLEYSFEASLYDECTEKIMTLIMDISEAQDEGELKQIIPTFSTIPQVTLSMFYAGLLEHHSNEVKSKEDAKALLKEVFAEDKTKSFYSVLSTLIETMREDGFFDRMGISEMMEQPKRGRKKAIPTA